MSLRGRRAQIRFSRGARGEKPENDRPPFWFYGESIRTSVHGSHNVSCGSAIIGMPSCVYISLFLRGAIAVEARRKRAASASIYIYIYIYIYEHEATQKPISENNIGYICFIKQVFRVKKLVGRRWGAPNSNYLLAMGWPGTFVMPFSITLNASHAHIKQTHTCIHRHTQTCTDTHIIQTQTYTRTHTVTHITQTHTHNMCCVCVCVCVCTWQSTNLYMITPCNG